MVVITSKVLIDCIYLFRYGITTGYSAVVVTINVEKSFIIVVFGVGCVGLSII